MKSGTTEYRIIHFWVERQLGKPSVCENCGIIDAKKYGWANLSGQYKQDVSDWARLCTTCHNLIDKNHNRDKQFCKQGHPYLLINTYVYSDGRRSCVACRRVYRRQYVAVQKERVFV